MMLNWKNQTKLIKDETKQIRIKKFVLFSIDGIFCFKYFVKTDP